MTKFIERGIERQKRHLKYHKKLQVKKNQDQERLKVLAVLLIDAKRQIVIHKKQGIAVVSIETALDEIARWEMELTETS